MKLKAYQKTYNTAPYELYEFAEGAVNITDCEELSNAAKWFVASKAALEAALEKFDIEIG